MGSSSSRPSTPNGKPNWQVGSEVDAYDPTTEIWWPAKIVAITQGKEGKKANYLTVLCENESEHRIYFGAPKYSKLLNTKIAALGTHTHESLAAAAAEHFNTSPTAPTTTKELKLSTSSTAKKKKPKRKHKESKTKEEDSSPRHDMKTIQKDDQFDVLDIYQSSKTGKVTERWRKAIVVKTSNTKVLVHYEKWSNDYNAWIHMDEQPERFAPYGQHTDQEQATSSTASTATTATTAAAAATTTELSAQDNTTSTLTSAATPISSSSVSEGLQQLELRDECYGKDVYKSKQTGEKQTTWRHSTVIEIKNDAVKLHFTDWSEKWDDWFDLTSGNVMTLEEYDATVGRHTKTSNTTPTTPRQRNQREERGGGGQPATESRDSKRDNSNVITVRTAMPRTRGDGTCFKS